MLTVNIIGVLLGALIALFVVRSKRTRAAPEVGETQAAAPPSAHVLTRRQRAAAMLADMQKVGQGQRTMESVLSSQSPSADAGQVSEDDEEEWSDEDDEEDEESEADEEFVRLESLRLKLVLVVLHGDVKLPAQDVAVLVSSAAVSEIGQILGECSGGGESLTLLCPSRQRTTEQQLLWKEWYAGWNMVGCAKITLKAPQEGALTEVFEGAQAAGLPCCMLRKSYLESIKVSPTCAPAAMSAGGKKKRGAHAAAVPATGPVSNGPAHDPFVVVAVGPAPAEALDPFTGSLKLFS